jgi:hypothetical protein
LLRALTEIGGVDDHQLISVVEERYRLIETIRAGVAPLSSDITALKGFVGGDPKPTLWGYLIANDSAGLLSYVRNQSFLDSLVYTLLVTPISSNAVALGPKGNVAKSLFDPAQINRSRVLGGA